MEETCGHSNQAAPDHHLVAEITPLVQSALEGAVAQAFDKFSDVLQDISLTSLLELENLQSYQNQLSSRLRQLATTLYEQREAALR